jgi:branched-chain amino acid transport system substrate-binding protein
VRLFRAVVAVSACAGALGLVACGGDDGGGGGDGGGGKTLKIGAIYPLSGANASAGVDVLHGAELAVDIINKSYPDIELPLAAEEGLPGMDGAKIELVSADTAGEPEKGASEVDRLVTSENVLVVTGAYQSAVTLTASERAERLAVPFVNGASSAVGLTERGLQWFFRTGPNDETFGRGFFEFLEAQKAAGRKAQRAAIIHTNDEYGTDGAEITAELAQEYGVEIVADVKYDPTTTDLTSQVQRLRASRPDVVFDLSYTNDAILLIKTMRRLGYFPPALLAYGAGFADPAFLEGVGNAADGSMTRAAWSLELAQERPATKAVAEMFEERFGQPMTENSARSFTAVMTIAQAIDQAGSEEPQAIKAALEQIDIPAEDTIMPWDGIRFDPETRQNTLAKGVIEQLVDGEYKVVFPEEVASTEAVWPMSEVR